MIWDMHEAFVTGLDEQASNGLTEEESNGGHAKNMPYK